MIVTYEPLVVGSTAVASPSYSSIVNDNGISRAALSLISPIASLLGTAAFTKNESESPGIQTTNHTPLLSAFAVAADVRSVFNPASPSE